MVDSIERFMNMPADRQEAWVKRHIEDGKVMTLIWTMIGMIEALEHPELQELSDKEIKIMEWEQSQK